MTARLLPRSPTVRSLDVPDGDPSLLPVRLPAQLRRLGDRLPVVAVLLVLSGQLPGQLLLPGGWTGVGGGRAGWLVVGVGLLAGLPHGAVDHLLPAWVRPRRTPPRVLVLLLTGYVLAGALMYALLRLLPLVALVLFLVLSAGHFGSGERVYAGLRPPASRRATARRRTVARRPRHVLAVLAWGATPVLLPLVVRPAEVAPVLDAFAPGAGSLLPRAAAAALVVVVLTAAAVTITQDLLAGRRRQSAELALLVALFAFVPPLVAFGCYFGAWHSLRHTVRLVATDPANTGDLAAGRLARPLRRFARQTALPTAVALLALGLLLAVTHGRHGLLAADLTLLAALTVPHLIAVAWLDRQRPAGSPPQGPVRHGASVAAV